MKRESTLIRVVDRQVQEIDRRIHGSRRRALPKVLDKQQVGNRVLHFESGTQVLTISMRNAWR